MKKYHIKMIVFIIFSTIAVLCFNYYIYQDPFYFIKGSIEIPEISFTHDQDQDGINDLKDIVVGARQDVQNKTNYKSVYYSGGYPPKNEGVCTDVVWRGLKNAGFDLKTSMDKDIKEFTKDYASGVEKPDPNIDFRRVKNQLVFFKKYATSLTIDVIPYNKDNLSNWQYGDIVVLEKGDHIAIVSDKRRKDGVPYIIHNASSYAKEENILMNWSVNKRIIGHFRYPKT